VDLLEDLCTGSHADSASSVDSRAQLSPQFAPFSCEKEKKACTKER